MTLSNLAKRALQISSILAMIFLFSCGSNGSQGEKESKLFSEAEEKIFKNISKIIGELPPPSVVPTTMQQIGAPYDPDLTNDIEKLDSYLTNPDKAALNLGIYAADIGYLIAYDQVQESMDHMTACQKLAENLGVASAFDLDMIRKYEAAMDDHNRLIELLNETILTAEQRLGDSDQLANAGLVLTGSFIEGLYLAMTVVKAHHKANRRNADEDQILEPLVKLVLQQKKPLEDIIGLLKEIPTDPVVTKMIAELNILKILYDGDMAEVEEKLKADPDMIITEDMLFDINLEVARIRNGITN